MQSKTFQVAKGWLQKIDWVVYINSALKAGAVKRQYENTLRRYAMEAGVPRPLSVIAKATSKSSGAPDQKVSLRNIFWLGTDEQQDLSGVVQALKRLGRVTCFTRRDGSYGQNDPAPYQERRHNNTQQLLDLVEGLSRKNEAPDMLIAQTWACLVDPVVFSEIRRRYGTYIVNISMDDRHQFWGQRVKGEWSGVYPLIPHIDLALTTAPEAVIWYEKEGCPALYFPEASDPEIFYPMPELPKTHEVSFVGSCYGIREKVVTKLRKAGIQVAAYGSGWASGRISTEMVPKLFAQSKIVLGVSAIGHCTDFVGLKLRDFDAPMSGSCYLTQHNDDLDALYDIDREIVTWRTLDECVEKTRYLLAHAEEREAIAAAGRARAISDHTWDERFHMLMTRLGMI